MATKYQPSEIGKKSPTVVRMKEGQDIVSVAIGGTVTRPAKPPKRGEVTIKEATAGQYAKLYALGGVYHKLIEEKTA